MSDPKTDLPELPEPGDPPRPPRRLRRLVAPDRVRDDGRAGVELRAHRRHRRPRRRAARRSRSPGWPGWSAARSRWRPASTSRSRARTSRPRPSSTSSGTSCAHNSDGRAGRAGRDVRRPRRRPGRSPRRWPRQLSRDPDQALLIHAQEELGVDPAQLPSPWTAAWSSLASFSVGAFVPLLPYLFGANSLWISAVLAVWSRCSWPARPAPRFTSRTWLYAGLRQLILGVLAAGRHVRRRLAVPRRSRAKSAFAFGRTSLPKLARTVEPNDPMRLEEFVRRWAEFVLRHRKWVAGFWGLVFVVGVLAAGTVVEPADRRLLAARPARHRGRQQDQDAVRQRRRHQPVRGHRDAAGRQTITGNEAAVAKTFDRRRAAPPRACASSTRRTPATRRSGPRTTAPRTRSCSTGSTRRRPRPC